MNREKIQKAFDELKISGSPITHSALAIACGVSEDVASTWLVEYVDIADSIKRHNTDLFGGTDGRRNRRSHNIKKICDAIRNHNTTDKKIIKEITGMSISAIYNLWNEEDVKMALKNVN